MFFAGAHLPMFYDVYFLGATFPRIPQTTRDAFEIYRISFLIDRYAHNIPYMKHRITQVKVSQIV